MHRFHACDGTLIGLRLVTAHFDGGRLMDGLLRRVVLRQSAMHHPAKHRQHHDKQADTELAAERMPSGIDPGTRVAAPISGCRACTLSNPSLVQMRIRRSIVEPFSQANPAGHSTIVTRGCYPLMQ